MTSRTQSNSMHPKFLRSAFPVTTVLSQRMQNKLRESIGNEGKYFSRRLVMFVLLEYNA
jgi:hypothetical protein